MLRFSKSYSLPTTGFLFLFLLGFDCALCMVWCNVFISGCSSFLPLFFSPGLQGWGAVLFGIRIFFSSFFSVFLGGGREWRNERRGRGTNQISIPHIGYVKCVHASTQLYKKEKPK